MPLNGKRHSLGRVVDQDDHVLESLVPSRRHPPAAKHCFRQLRKGLTSVPRVSMPDKLKSDGASHAGVAVSGTCPKLCGGVWPHRPTLPAATALVVRGGIPRREEKPLRALGRKNGYGAGRIERKEDRRGVPTRLRRVSTSTT